MGLAANGPTKHSFSPRSHHPHARAIKSSTCFSNSVSSVSTPYPHDSSPVPRDQGSIPSQFCYLEPSCVNLLRMHIQGVGRDDNDDRHDHILDGRRVSLTMSAERMVDWHDIFWDGRASGLGLALSTLSSRRPRPGSLDILRSLQELRVHI